MAATFQIPVASKTNRSGALGTSFFSDGWVFSEGEVTVGKVRLQGTWGRKYSG